MDEIETWRAAKFLIGRRGADAAKARAARRALEVADTEDQAAWLQILQAIIDLSPSTEAETPLN